MWAKVVRNRATKLTTQRGQILFERQKLIQRGSMHISGEMVSNSNLKLKSQKKTYGLSIPSKMIRITILQTTWISCKMTTTISLQLLKTLFVSKLEL